MSHYSKAQNPEALLAWSVYAASVLVKRFKTERVCPVLVYSGYSGAASATALALELHRNYPTFRFGMVYVRKLNEQSHGSPKECQLPLQWTDNQPVYCGVFIDDFVSSGETKRHCVQSTKDVLRWAPSSLALLSGWESSDAKGMARTVGVVANE